MERETVTPMATSTVGSPATDPGLRGRVVAATAALLPRVLRREVAPVGEDTRLMEDLGLTSASTLELLLELEEALGVEINVEDVEREDFATVGSLADYIAGHTLPAE